MSLLLLPLLLLQGYPGMLETSVRYELLSHSAELRITISATTDKATPGAACDQSTSGLQLRCKFSSLMI
jgi:hypothetical protein